MGRGLFPIGRAKKKNARPNGGKPPPANQAGVVLTIYSEKPQRPGTMPADHFCSSLWRASRAALCSASFLLWPLPSPSGMPFTSTRKVKVLL